MASLLGTLLEILRVLRSSAKTHIKRFPRSSWALAHQQNDNGLERLESLELLDLVALVTLDQILVYLQILITLVFDSRSSYFSNQQSKL